MKPIVFEERKSKNSLGLTEKNNKFNVDESVDMIVENESEIWLMKHGNRMLEKDVEMQEEKLRADSEIVGLNGVAQKYLSPVTKGPFLELFSSFFWSTFINANSENKIGPIFPDSPGP